MCRSRACSELGNFLVLPTKLRNTLGSVVHSKRSHQTGKPAAVGPLIDRLSSTCRVCCTVAASWLRIRWPAFHHRGAGNGTGLQVGRAVAVGCAICSMHGTGMAAARSLPSAALPDLSHTVAISATAIDIAQVTFIVVGLAVLTWLVERRIDTPVVQLELVRAQLELIRVGRTATTSEMTATLAHEINQPLAAVVTYGNACLRWLTKRPPDLDEARAAVTRTIQEATRAGDIVVKIRALLANAAPEMKRLDMNEVIRRALALAGGELARNGITVHTVLAADLLTVMSDRIQMKQVLLNLILNAIDAMSSIGEGERELLVRSSSGHDCVLIQVCDSGRGVDPDLADRIFDPFFTTKVGGIGLGLSISRSIVEAHGGHLWAGPWLPHGTAFAFTLPAA